jgi:hypothetical protein
LFNLQRPQSDGIALPPRVPLVAPPLHTSLHCGCLFLVGFCFSNIHRRPYKATTYFCIYICSTLSSPPQTMVTPTRSVQVVRPPEYPPHRDRGLLVGCCVVCSNGGHLRPRPRPSICFSKGCISAPQTKEPTMAKAQPMPLALYGPIGSSGAKIWVHGGCCHGERGPKPLKGRTAAAHVGCCVLWLCFVLWLPIEY